MEKGLKGTNERYLVCSFVTFYREVPCDFSDVKRVCGSKMLGNTDLILLMLVMRLYRWFCGDLGLFHLWFHVAQYSINDAYCLLFPPKPHLSCSKWLVNLFSHSVTKHKTPFRQSIKKLTRLRMTEV